MSTLKDLTASPAFISQIKEELLAAVKAKQYQMETPHGTLGASVVDFEFNEALNFEDADGSELSWRIPIKADGDAEISYLSPDGEDEGAIRAATLEGYVELEFAPTAMNDELEDIISSLDIETTVESVDLEKIV